MPGTAASACVAAIVLALAGTAAASCGESGPTAEEAVRAKLVQFADATRERRYDRLCGEVLAPELIDEIKRTGRPCPDALRGALGDVRDPQLTIGRVRVQGARASAEVRTVAAGQEPSRDIVELVKRPGGWRISSLSGASPPAPAP